MAMNHANWWATLSMLSLGVVFVQAALAAPPPPHTGMGLRLDLRPPAPTALETPGRDAIAFPSMRHRSLETREETSLPAIGASNVRVPGRVEEFARRVRREGLPVARLWETKSALVSLGLNQRGKPGLWLIQKTH